jgi:hypothetical protein
MTSFGGKMADGIGVKPIPTLSYAGHRRTQGIMMKYVKNMVTMHGLQNILVIGQLLY